MEKESTAKGVSIITCTNRPQISIMFCTIFKDSNIR